MKPKSVAPQSTVMAVDRMVMPIRIATLPSRMT